MFHGFKALSFMHYFKSLLEVLEQAFFISEIYRVPFGQRPSFGAGDSAYYGKLFDFLFSRIS